MSTAKLLESLQRWLQSGKEKGPDTREEGCGAKGAEAPGGDQHETQDHKSGRSSALDTLPPVKRSISIAACGPGRRSPLLTA
jgi:hypothetical protein